MQEFTQSFVKLELTGAELTSVLLVSPIIAKESLSFSTATLFRFI